MIGRKKEKLILIAPNGKEYLIGFLTRCSDGFVLGTTQGQENKSHLTILNKDNVLSAHITQQNSLRRPEYFTPLSLKDMKNRLQSLVDNKMIFQLSQEHLSEEVFYLTKKFEEWFDDLTGALFQKETRNNCLIYFVNFKRLFDVLPDLVNRLRTAPQSFFGVCKAEHILSDSSIVVGINNSGLLILPIEKELMGIDIRALMNFEFTPASDKSKFESPLNEIYQSMGINQYIKQEVIEKQFLEKLLKPETWQAEAAKLEAKLKESNHQ
jgi:hypothetical protein